MTNSSPARAADRRVRWFVFAAILAAVASFMALAAPPLDGVRGSPGGAGANPPPLAEDFGQQYSDGGVVSDRLSAFDESASAIANLSSPLLDALQQAAKDAAYYGIDVVVTSGWRSPQYQDELLKEAVAEYGSAEEAARWVATPETSAHVSGDAVDIGYAEASAWLSAYGAGYGLCQIYGNEPWHFELRPEAVTSGCPDMYADPTLDPRMHPGVRS